jgi:hypothetical protein
MEEVTSRVLAKSSSDAVKSMYTRALVHWQAPPSAPASISADDGEKVSWDSDDDL